MGINLFLCYNKHEQTHATGKSHLTVYLSPIRFDVSTAPLLINLPDASIQTP